MDRMVKAQVNEDFHRSTHPWQAAVEPSMVGDLLPPGLGDNDLGMTGSAQSLGGRPTLEPAQEAMLLKQFERLDSDSSGQLEGNELAELSLFCLTLVKRPEASVRQARAGLRLGQPAQLEADVQTLLGLIWEESTGY